jgi:hypothetical protein
VSEPRPAVGWADGQAALRARAAGAGFAPAFVPVAYRLVAADGRPPPGAGLAPRLVLLVVAAAVMLIDRVGPLSYALLALGFVLIVRWFREGGRRDASMALYAPGTALEGVPRLVLAIAAADAARVGPSGTGRAFGDLAPGGVLGVVVGAATVWPTGPPRAGTWRDLA